MAHNKVVPASPIPGLTSADMAIIADYLRVAEIALWRVASDHVAVHPKADVIETLRTAARQCAALRQRIVRLSSVLDS